MSDAQVMERTLAILLLGLWSLSSAQVDPLEPDDALPFLGAGMNGGDPDFTFPSDNIIGRDEGWRISGRSLNGSQDRDWMIFYGDEYPYCEVRGELRIIPVGSNAAANLQVEVLGYARSSVIDSTVSPVILQSCSQAPRGGSTIELLNDSLVGRSDFRTFYRLRNCRNAGVVEYRFELEITQPGFCFALSNVEGNVRDIRNGRLIKGAYIFSNQNNVTFSSPETGQFGMFVSSGSNVVLDFFSGELESVGPVSIGSVAPSDYIPGVELLGQPAGMIFFSGFE
ncbi:MAG: hypothetical protein AB8B96_04615 [Lysobacterales bacterium]